MIISSASHEIQKILEVVEISAHLMRYEGIYGILEALPVGLDFVKKFRWGAFLRLAARGVAEAHNALGGPRRGRDPPLEREPQPRLLVLVERYDAVQFGIFQRILSNFRGLVLFCIDADICHQIPIF